MHEISSFNMFYNLKKLIKTRLFNYQVRGVLKVASVKCDQASDVALVSQLCSRDVMMYLVAIKTFTRFIMPKRVIIVSDSLSETDLNTLYEHVEHLEIIDIANVSTDGFPSGGTWERLLTIIDASADQYVIQLDADTITTSKPTEVLDCIEQNRSFTLGTWMGQNVIGFDEVSELIKKQQISSTHVQVVAELAMAEFDRAEDLKYIRGCSGFAGFGKDISTREQLLPISRTFDEKLGRDKWAEWGSEQVFSSIVIANSSDPLVLPINKYSYFSKGLVLENCCFVHFIGSNRFDGGVYGDLAVREINAMTKGI